MALIHCRNCGSLISNHAKDCPICGCSQENKEIQCSDTHWGIYLVSCFIPIAGMVLMWDKDKVKARSALEGTIIGLIFQAVAYFIFRFSVLT